MSPADRRLCQELVYGMVRWQATLDWLVARKTRQRPRSPILRAILHLGLYQILWLDRIPDHAAVYETVQLARRNGLAIQAGFVNGLLRSCLRERTALKRLLAGLKTSQPHLGYSHPEWLVQRWQQRWGAQRAAQLMEWNNTPPRTYGRLNTLKTQPDLLMTAWREEGVEFLPVQRDWIEENRSFELVSHPPLEKLASFARGLFYVQDPGTLLAVKMLQPRPGERVLDLCAAPGGKLTYIAQLMENRGRLCACDIDPDRFELVRQNCARLGVTCVEPIAATALNRRSVPLAPSPGGEGRGEGEPHSAFCIPNSALRKDAGEPSSVATFDRILIDAPCSNTGVMRRRVDLRWRIQPEEILRLQETQLSLLRQAAPLLKPGGTLVYSTCSLEPEENQQTVKSFLERQKSFRLEQERELLPFNEGVDGAYVAVMARLTSP